MSKTPIQRALVGNIVLASENVIKAREKCVAARREVDRIERLLTDARTDYVAATKERDRATDEVHDIVREYAELPQPETDEHEEQA